jgi:hypothetical protein
MEKTPDNVCEKTSQFQEEQFRCKTYVFEEENSEATELQANVQFIVI